ncbi:hypothetical protein [Streptomyces sp. SID161]|uniref:phage scaffolding protein n=1 Tax=Streptomyces sp. SID161 TaxID=2690251 RepID=UPI00136BB579|nr:hypothetical protein [Streptomyces sp. SID161]MYW43061.1 hypothetical protein [Streptomyces sp. SID161]
MRRPAQQHRLGPTPAPGWAHPYTGLTGLAVFYNDGGEPPAQPPVPSPADLAARGQQAPQPPAPASDPDEDKVSLTQRRLNVLMKSEKDEGRRAAFRQIAEAAGLDPDTFDPNQFGALFQQAEQARQAQLSEEQRRQEDLDRREQELQARIDAAAQREADAAKRDRDSRIRAALVGLGATGDDLEDAAALIRVTDDADETAISEAAAALKARRAELFGAPTPQTLPPAPTGGPAAGSPPRPPVAGKDAIRQSAIARAEAMGLRTAS